MNTIYISGPMRGYKNLNYDEFYKAEKQLNKYFKVINPARLDEEKNIVTKIKSFLKKEDEQRTFARRDLLAIIDKCTHIYMLKGWENSIGANAELACAKWCGCEVVYQEPVNTCDEEGKSVCSVADGLINGARSEAYGHPYDDFTKTSGMWNSLGYRIQSPNGDIRLLNAADVPVAMVCVKLSRMTNHKNNNHMDSIIDGCGYFGTLQKVIQRIKQLCLE